MLPVLVRKFIAHLDQGHLASARTTEDTISRFVGSRPDAAHCPELVVPCDLLQHVVEHLRGDPNISRWAQRVLWALAYSDENRRRMRTPHTVDVLSEALAAAAGSLPDMSALDGAFPVSSRTVQTAARLTDLLLDSCSPKHLYGDDAPLRAALSVPGCCGALLRTVFAVEACVTEGVEFDVDLLAKVRFVLQPAWAERPQEFDAYAPLAAHAVLLRLDAAQAAVAMGKPLGPCQATGERAALGAACNLMQHEPGRGVLMAHASLLLPVAIRHVRSRANGETGPSALSAGLSILKFAVRWNYSQVVEVLSPADLVNALLKLTARSTRGMLEARKRAEQSMIQRSHENQQRHEKVAKQQQEQRQQEQEQRQQEQRQLTFQQLRQHQDQMQQRWREQQLQQQQQWQQQLQDQAAQQQQPLTVQQLQQQQLQLQQHLQLTVQQQQHVRTTEQRQQPGQLQAELEQIPLDWSTAIQLIERILHEESATPPPPSGAPRCNLASSPGSAAVVAGALQAASRTRTALDLGAPEFQACDAESTRLRLAAAVTELCLIISHTVGAPGSASVQWACSLVDMGVLRVLTWLQFLGFETLEGDVCKAHAACLYARLQLNSQQQPPVQQQQQQQPEQPQQQQQPEQTQQQQHQHQQQPQQQRQQLPPQLDGPTASATLLARVHWLWEAAVAAGPDAVCNVSKLVHRFPLCARDVASCPRFLPTLAAHVVGDPHAAGTIEVVAARYKQLVQQQRAALGGEDVSYQGWPQCKSRGGSCYSGEGKPPCASCGGRAAESALQRAEAALLALLALAGDAADAAAVAEATAALEVTRRMRRGEREQHVEGEARLQGDEPQLQVGKQQEEQQTGQEGEDNTQLQITHQQSLEEEQRQGTEEQQQRRQSHGQQQSGRGKQQQQGWEEQNQQEDSAEQQQQQQQQQIVEAQQQQAQQGHPQEDASHQQCAACGSRSRDQGGGKLLKCAGCEVVRYCSKACQAKDWKGGHKAVCASMKEERRA